MDDAGWFAARRIDDRRDQRAGGSDPALVMTARLGCPGVWVFLDRRH
jgi:hypothetical protein